MGDCDKLYYFEYVLWQREAIKKDHLLKRGVHCSCRGSVPVVLLVQAYFLYFPSSIGLKTSYSSTKNEISRFHYNYLLHVFTVNIGFV